MGDTNAIRRRHYTQGQGVRRIARDLGISRNTVRAVLRDEHDGDYTLGEPRRRPVTGPHLAEIDRLLRKEQSDGTRRKQRLTATRIYVLLKKEHGYAGSEASVRRVVRHLRQELGVPLEEAFVPLSYDPGVDGQADFFTADVRVAGQLRTAAFLVVRSCYATRHFVRRVPAENQEALFEALTAAFVYFGGVFHSLWFDYVPDHIIDLLWPSALCGRVRRRHW